MQPRQLTRWLVPAAICAALLSVVYVSTLFSVYDYHDGYFHYVMDAGAPCDDHPQWRYMLLLGRPVYNFLNCKALDALVWTPADAYKIRLVGISGLILCATYVARMMARRGLPMFPASVFASGLFAVPGLFVFINMTSDVANVFAVAAATAAFACLDRVQIWSPTRAAVPFGLAILLLLLGMLTYQQAMPLVFALAAVAIVLKPEREKAWTLVAASIFAFMFAGLFFLILHIGVLTPYLESINGEPVRLTFPEAVKEMSIRFAPALALTNFIDNFPRVFPVWFMNFADRLWLAVFALFAVCGAAFIASSDDWRGRGARLVWCVLLFGAVNGLTLLTAEREAPHRHSIPFEVMIIAVIVLVLYLVPRGQRVFRTAAVLFVLCGIGYSSWNVYFNLVKPSAAELAYFTGALKSYAPGERVCFIRSYYEVMGDYRSTAIDIRNEFGRVTSMFESDVKAYTAAVAKSFGINPHAMGAPANLAPETTATPPDCKIVIDMRTFQKQYAERNGIPLISSAWVPASPARAAAAPESAAEYR